MTLKRIVLCILFMAFAIPSFSQQQKKPTPAAGVLYFSLAGEKNGKLLTITKETGRIVEKDSLKMADRITAYYKLGQKAMNVKGIVYDNYFFGADGDKEPTILQDMHGLTFDVSIWISCLDSLAKQDQIVFQIKEITLDDGTKIQHPKLAKENKEIYKVYTNPNFPEGGWKNKADHWIDMWKGWFKPTDNTFYKLDERELELYAYGVVYIVKTKPEPKSKK